NLIPAWGLFDHPQVARWHIGPPRMPTAIGGLPLGIAAVVNLEVDPGLRSGAAGKEIVVPAALPVETWIAVVLVDVDVGVGFDVVEPVAIVGIAIHHGVRKAIRAVAFVGERLLVRLVDVCSATAVGE